MKPDLRGVLEAIESRAPWDLAESWDNPGLQVGDPAMPVGKILVALDAGEEELRRGAELGADVLLTHHPMIFRPLQRLDLGERTARLAQRALATGMAVVAAHTNLDAARGGLADCLAGLLELHDAEPLLPGGGELLKLVTFVPPSARDAVAGALREIGAGRIGKYEGCSFTVPGRGSFTPLEGARPTVGEVGRPQSTDEERLEMILPVRLAARALNAVRRTHPYEEPVIDLCVLAARERGVGIGRVGDWRGSADAFVDLVRGRLGNHPLRSVGRPPAALTRAAVLPGSGGGEWRRARDAGAGVFLTGEIRYHEALEAAAEGFWVLEGGHGVTEGPAVGLLAGWLRDAARENGWELAVHAMERDREPFDAR